MHTHTCRALCVSFSTISGASLGQFQEPGSLALHTFTGTGGFGWAASAMSDVTGDGRMEAMISAPNALGGYIDLYDGATGALVHRFRGQDHGIVTFGFSLADAGDVNGDAVPDIVGGAPNSGAVLIFSGADFSLIHRVNQSQAGERLGYSVAGVGDLDADGFDDVIAGAPQFDLPGIGNIGRLYLISGGTGAVMGTVGGETAADLFGTAAGAIGDINADGVPDFAVGANNAGPTGRGAVYIYDGATLLPAFARIDALATGVILGDFFVGPAGDADNDGTPDIYAGDYSDSASGGGTGRAYVISGATGQILWTRAGSGAGQGMGPGRAAGDINFDGFDDLAVGSYTAGNGATQAGRVQILSGLDGSIIRTVTNTIAGQQFGFDAVGIGDVSGDGLIDILVASGGGNAGSIVRGENPCPPDINLDGAASTDDFASWIAAYNAGDRKADLNRDELVAPNDFTAWIASFNAGCP